MDGKTWRRHVDQLRHFSGVNSNANGTETVVTGGGVLLLVMVDESAVQDGGVPGSTEVLIAQEDIPALGEVEPIQSPLPLQRSARSNLGVPPDQFT